MRPSGKIRSQYHRLVTMQIRFEGLWRHPDFLKLWSGQTVSMFGTQVTFLALPLAAVLTLDATPLQMGVLTAVGGLPPILIGLVVGAWVDRLPRRPILIAANWGRALLIMVVPVSALLNALSIELLYVVAFGSGALSLVFAVAYRSYLPSLVDRDHIIEGNSKLEMSRSASELAGPGLGGVLVQLLTAPIALVVDAATFVVSAISLQLIRTPEPASAPSEGRQSIWKESREGMKLVGANPLLRALAGYAGTIGLFNALFEAVALLYMSRELGLSPGLIGLVGSVGGVGFLVGTLTVEPVTRRIGLGATMVGAVALMPIADLVLPLAGGPLVAIVILLAMGQFLFGIGFTAYNIAGVSLRQAITPMPFQGRMNATMQVLVVGTVPLGALVGGALGETFDLKTALFAAVAGELLAVLWLVFSPVRRLRESPSPAEGLRRNHGSERSDG